MTIESQRQGIFVTEGGVNERTSLLDNCRDTANWYENKPLVVPRQVVEEVQGLGEAEQLERHFPRQLVNVVFPVLLIGTYRSFMK